ncbi:MAG: efflux RND transporter periplasmic adaptor subunit [Verrucomicrobiales bacterium]
MLVRLLIPVMILMAGFFAYQKLSTALEPPKPQHVPRQKLRTEVVELQRTDYPVLLETQGVVRAHHETPLTAVISGTITKIHPSFEDGAYFRQGEILAELDPADFQAAYEAAEAQVARAEAALAQEEATARQARLNWEDLGYDGDPSPLVLRIPQLKEANANVDAARAELDQANLNLKRTKIRAPFDGRVRERLVGLGQSVGSSTPLGEVYATDYAEVRLPLTPEQLAFIDLPSRPKDPTRAVTLTSTHSINPDGSAPQWQAEIVRTEGTLDDSSRELFAIAQVHDPFGLETGKPPLRIGQPVRASVEGRVLKDVFVIPRLAMRGVGRIYLVDQVDPAIVRTRIEPIWSNSEVLVVKDGLEAGQWLSTTRLPYAPDGAPVEVVDSISAAAPSDEIPGS